MKNSHLSQTLQARPRAVTCGSEGLSQQYSTNTEQRLKGPFVHVMAVWAIFGKS